MRYLGGQPRPSLYESLARWDKTADQLKIKRLGFGKGNPFDAEKARSRLPFALPKNYRVYEDGSIQKLKLPQPDRKPKVYTRRDIPDPYKRQV